jgi:hypothetical protein
VISFERIINDYTFSFEENVISTQVYFDIRIDIYSFKMMPEEASWTIVGDVPPWIAQIENKLSDIIDSELMKLIEIIIIKWILPNRCYSSNDYMLI